MIIRLHRQPIRSILNVYHFPYAIMRDVGGVTTSAALCFKVPHGKAEICLRWLSDLLKESRQYLKEVSLRDCHWAKKRVQAWPARVVARSASLHSHLSPHNIVMDIGIGVRAGVVWAVRVISWVYPRNDAHKNPKT